MSKLKYYKSPKGDTRPQISKAIEMVVDRYVNNEQSTSISLPPRFGKSTVIRGSAIELVKNMGAMTSFIIGPWKMLSNQILSKESVAAEFRRYGIKDVQVDGYPVERISDHTFWRSGGHRGKPFTMVAFTAGLLLNNREAALGAISYIAEKSGKRVPIFIDEAHLFKGGKPYGDTVQKLADAGGYIVVLTGTPWSNDPNKLWGFKFVATEDISGKTVQTDGIDVDEDGSIWVKKRPVTYHGQSGYFEANYEVSYKKAFAIKAMQKFDVVFCDPLINIGGERKRASEVDFSKPGIKLREVVEDPLVTESVCESVFHHMIQKNRASGERSTALIITGSDFNGDERANRHARSVRRCINDIQDRLGTNYIVSIATSVNEDGTPNDKAEQTIKDFRDGRGADILIVKMMGLVGLDSPQLKTMGFLSTIRNGPLTTQAMTRTATIWKDLRISGTLVAPKDMGMVTAVEELQSEGGVTSRQTVTELGEEFREPLEESPDIDIEVESVSKTHGNSEGSFYDDKIGEFCNDQVLLVLRNRYPYFNELSAPQLLAQYKQSRGGCMSEITKSEVEKAMEEAGGSFADDTAEFTNNFDEIKEVRKELDDEIKSGAGEVVPYKEGTQKVWVEAKQKITVQCKIAAGIEMSFTDCTDLEALKEAKAAVPKAVAIVKRKMRSKV